MLCTVFIYASFGYGRANLNYNIIQHSTFITMMYSIRGLISFRFISFAFIAVGHLQSQTKNEKNYSTSHGWVVLFSFCNIAFMTWLWNGVVMNFLKKNKNILNLIRTFNNCINAFSLAQHFQLLSIRSDSEHSYRIVI